jgi:hypothetical protein
MSNITQQIKSALRKAFPATKFKVTRNGGDIEWTDDGPSVEQVRDALLNAKCITEDEGKYFDGSRHFYANYDGNRHQNHIYFNRYNAAQREAGKAQAAQWREEYEDKRKRQDAAVSEALGKLAQRAGQIGQAFKPAPKASPEQLAPLNAALEQMRERAEADVATRFQVEEGDRRPSWAPPLILGEELAEACLELGYLTEEDKLVGRLWATFADPKRAGTWARKHESRHTLEGIQCRTFTLFAGPKRGNTSDILFEAQRKSDGTWNTGPSLPSYMPFFRSKDWEWNSLIRERVTIEDDLSRTIYADKGASQKARLAIVETKIAELEAADLEAHAKRKRKHELQHRAVELARVRVLDFLGAADAQMQEAARLCGHCAICFRELTDPISLEKGIGPECWGGIVHSIRGVYDRTGSIEETLRICFQTPASLVRSVIADYQQTAHHQQEQIEESHVHSR